MPDTPQPVTDPTCPMCGHEIKGSSGLCGYDCTCVRHYAADPQPVTDDREPKTCPNCGEVCTYDGWDHVHGIGLGIGSCNVAPPQPADDALVQAAAQALSAYYEGDGVAYYLHDASTAVAAVVPLIRAQCDADLTAARAEIERLRGAVAKKQTETDQWMEMARQREAEIERLRGVLDPDDRYAMKPWWS